MNRHPFSFFSLLAGVLMLGFSINWFVTEHDLVDGRQVALVGAAVLIAAGIAGITATLRSKP